MPLSSFGHGLFSLRYLALSKVVTAGGVAGASIRLVLDQVHSPSITLKI
jgi:hypothetical protein